jgi:hypothetical protein
MKVARSVLCLRSTIDEHLARDKAMSGTDTPQAR